MFHYSRQSQRAWNPLLEIQRVQAQMNRLLEGLEGSDTQEFPPIELWTGDDGLKLRALLPGFAPEDIDVTVVGDTFTLKAVRPPPQDDEKQAWHRRERNHGRFVRTLQLPYSVEAGKVVARCENGVLEVDLPRAESEKPRRIPVNAG